MDVADNEKLVSRLSPFGILLRRYRLAAGLSQDELAECARMSTDGISALERGIRRTPQRETVALLAQALKLAGEERQAFEAAAVRTMPRPHVGKSSFTASVLLDADAYPNHNLPSQLSSFVGREAEITEIANLATTHRLVTITGSGGVGKTRTALQVGGALLETLNDGVWLIELAPLADASSVAPTLALALGVQESPNRPLPESLVAHLKKKALLLILDNCDHVVAESAALAEGLLRGCRQLRILATSRESLRIPGEYTYRLPSLGVPTAGEAVRLSAARSAEYTAVMLFAERAQARDRRFALTDANAPIVAEICRRLDGIPLAIELAAARVKTLSLKALLEKLQQRFRILTGGDRTALPRHQTMRALIDWSYDLLTPSEQHLFDCLSVFAGGCTLTAATTVCAGEGVEELDVLDLLSSLVDKSLVVADVLGPEPRYRLLESSRQYAREKLAERGKDVIAAHHHSHALAYLEVAEWLERAWDTTPDRAWSALAEVELDNCRAALDWTFGGQGDVVIGQRLASAMYWVWITFACVEGRRWLRMAFELIDERTPTDVVTKVELAEGVIALWIGEYKAALASGTRASIGYRELGDRVGTDRAQCLVGRSLVFLGNIVEGEALLLELLEPARARGNHSLIGYILDSIGLARSQGGDAARARRYYAEALAVFEALGAERSVAAVVHNLAEAEFLAGDAEAAVRLESDALAAFRALNHTHYVSYALVNMTAALVNMAAILVTLARYDEARAHAREALDLSRELQLYVFSARTLQHLAAIAALRHPCDAERAVEEYTRAARLLGFAGARLAALGVSQERTGQAEYERAVAVLRNALGFELAQLITSGATMTEHDAIEEALRI
jgi:predicted ATPase/transcriptional regulator with XRE-family HTH domain